METKLQKDTAKVKAEEEQVKTAADLKAKTTELKEFQTKVADETKKRVELIGLLRPKTTRSIRKRRVGGEDRQSQHGDR